MKRQILVIHGGDVFEKYEDYLEYIKNRQVRMDKMKSNDFYTTFRERMGDEYEVLLPDMPCKANAKYLEWKIWFEKIIPFLNDEVILVGRSLGGIFIPKYLSENIFPKKIVATFLVAAPFDHDGKPWSLGDFQFTNNLAQFEKQAGDIALYHSKDDPVVPYSDFLKFKKALPDARYVTFEDRGHFSSTEFPELVEEIKKLT